MNGKHNQHNLCKEGEVRQKVYYIQIFGSLRYWMSNTSQCKVRTRIKKNKRPNKRPRLLMAMMTTFSPFSILCLRKKNWGWKIFFPSFLKNLFDMWDGENCDGEMWAGEMVISLMVRCELVWTMYTVQLYIVRSFKCETVLTCTTQT